MIGVNRRLEIFISSLNIVNCCLFFLIMLYKIKGSVLNNIYILVVFLVMCFLGFFVKDLGLIGFGLFLICE